VFSLCRRSRDEQPDDSRAGEEASPEGEPPAQRERYPRYPRIPVVECEGYERSKTAAAD
jgi:hypothetical protein